MISQIMQPYDYNVIEVFESQVQKTPDYIALIDKKTNYTYRGLNEKVNQLANCLKNKSVRQGDFVAILLDPSTEFIICILAIVKLGATYITLDTHAPKLRIKEILQDASPALLITNETYSPHLNEIDTKICLTKYIQLESSSHSKENLNSYTSPNAPLHMIYTSGSTGRPKGVLTPHQAVINITMLENTIQINEGDKIAQLSNLAFDGSAFEIWSSLLNGASLCIIPHEARYNHSKLKQALSEFKVTHLFLPSSFLHQIIKSAPDTLDNIKTILFGGEQVNASLIESFIAYRREKNRNVTLINGYGPTEATFYVYRQIIDANKSYDPTYLSSIGQLVTNTKAYILDENMQQVTEGELYISGANLALGYHHCIQQNSEKFLPNPFSTQKPYTRLYKTGDKVRQLESGDLLYLGRYDDQVKIGGFRIHLNEIETEIMKHPDVSMASVMVELGGGSHKILTAYLVLANKDTLVNADTIRDFIKNTLPYYMLPAKYIKVDELPLTLVGKVDKSKLEKLPHTDLSFHIDTSADSFIEEKIKDIFQHLLNRVSVDTNKNLFELGATSLLITEACSRINQELNSELLIGDILAHPTIHKLSRYLEGDITPIIDKRRRKEQVTDIAIIGMACRFPKSNNLNEYWKNLCEGNDCLDRFDLPSSLHDLPENYVPVRGTLSQIDEFDAHFFGFNSSDASLADPQQRLLLECAWEAMEHAAIAPSKLKDKIISIFAGMTDSTYLQENILKNSWVNTEYDLLHQRIACSMSMLSTQLSYRLNLKGRSINVNTACSTGLVAVDQACQDLILGYSDVALAGASSIIVPQQHGYSYQSGSIVSKDGYCRPFSQKANGTVFSNGVGVVVLKPLKEAIEDKNTIYAVIKGRGINNDGADKLGFSAPSTTGQMICIRTALEEAKINAGDITFLEAHGTATALGDVVEIDALNSVYREQTQETQYCALGSVKANIGHTDTAAGIAGLIKVALCLYHHKIPPLLHFENPNPNLALEKSPFYINKMLMDWDVGLKKRYAGVSSFGVGGTNAHMILSEHDNHLTSISDDLSKDELFIVSAKTKNALEDSIQNLIRYLSKPRDDGASLSNISYSLQTGREDFQWRSFAIGKTEKEIITEFTSRKPNVLHSNPHTSMVFMFPGQGTQYQDMAMELFDALPEFSAYVNHGISIAKSFLNRDLLAIIRNPDQKELHLTQYAQPVLFILEYALAKVLMDYGIKPDTCIGHSLGEYVAACIAGVFTYEDGIALVCKRGLLMASAPPGEMLAISCTKKEFLQFTKIAPVELALHNSPSHLVAAGESKSIKILENHLNSIQKKYQKLQVSHAFHSNLMEKIKEPFIDLLTKMPLSPPKIPIISNVTGTWLSPEKATDPYYWYEHLRHTVQLCQGFETILQDKHPFFLEVGVGSSLCSFVKDLSAKDRVPNTAHVLPSRNKKTNDMHQFLMAVGALWQQGISIQWEKLYGNQKATKIALPSYPFQRERHWIEPDTFNPQGNQHKLYTQTWTRKSLPSSPLLPELIRQHTWIIFKDTANVSASIISLLQSYDADVVIVESYETYQEIALNHFKINVACKEHYEKIIQKIKSNVKSPFFLHLFSLQKIEKKYLTESEMNHLLDLGLYSVMYWIQGVSQVMGDNFPLKGLVLTTGTQKITSSEKIQPVNASLHGACKVIRQEHASISIRSMDIDIPKTLSARKTRASSLIKLLMEERKETHFVSAIRGNYKWEQHFQPIISFEEMPIIKDRGVYLITGGLGGIALTLSEKMTNLSRELKLILISRAPVISKAKWKNILKDSQHPNYSQIVALKRIEDAGATIFWHQVDINDEKPLRKIITKYKQKFGHINGIIHCAGVPGSGLMQLKTKTQAQQILMPKLAGTYNLAKAFQGIPLDFVALMSSIASLVGEPGQFDYAAANSCLDAFPIADLFTSSCLISINWNTWQKIGMSVNNVNSNNVTFLNRGNDISPEEGKDLFIKILKSSYSNVAVSNYALDQHELVTQQRLQCQNQNVTQIPREKLNIENEYSPPQTAIEKKLIKLWQENLGIDSIGVNDDFFNLGGHSLKGLQLIDKVNKQFKSSFSIQHLYHGPTVRNFSLLIENPNPDINIIVPMKELDKKPPYVFVFHPASGVINCFSSFVTIWSHPIPIYGLQDPSVSTGELPYDSIQSLAKDYLKAIKKIQPKGPYYFIGYSFGGTICYEIATLLKEENEQINLLALIESWCVFSETQHNEELFLKNFQASHPSIPPRLVSLAWQRMQLLLNYTPSNSNHDMLLFKATELIEDYQSINHPTNGWSKYNHGNIFCHSIKADHDTILDPINSRLILDMMNEKEIF